MLRHALKIRISAFQNPENPSLTWLCNLLLNNTVSQKTKLLFCRSFSLWNIPFYSKTSSPAKPSQIPSSTGFFMISLQTLFSWSRALSVPPEPIDPHLHTVALICPWYCCWWDLNLLGWISFCFGSAASR